MWFYEELTVGAQLVRGDLVPFKSLGFLSTHSLDASVLQNGDLIVGGPGSFYWQGMFPIRGKACALLLTGESRSNIKCCCPFLVAPEIPVHTFLTEASLQFALRCASDVSKVLFRILLYQEFIEAMPGFVLDAGDTTLRTDLLFVLKVCWGYVSTN